MTTGRINQVTTVQGARRPAGRRRSSGRRPPSRSTDGPELLTTARETNRFSLLANPPAQRPVRGRRARAPDRRLRNTADGRGRPPTRSHDPLLPGPLGDNGATTHPLLRRAVRGETGGGGTSSRFDTPPAHPTADARQPQARRGRPAMQATTRQLRHLQHPSQNHGLSTSVSGLRRLDVSPHSSQKDVLG